MREDGGDRNKREVVYNVDKILDAHTHLTGQESAEQILECMDYCGVEKVFIGVGATHKDLWQPGDSFRLSTSAGTAEVRASASGIRVDRQETEGVAILVEEPAFAHLLFRVFDAAAERVGTVPNPSLLQVLFPEQDFVVWWA